jgi:competence protein ComEA
MFKIIIAVVVVTIVGLFVMTQIDPNNPNNKSSSIYNYSSIVYDSDSMVKVAIAGQILHPGDYAISPQATLGDLISMAGGTTSNADPDSYTPSLLIGSRTSFYIPKVSDIPETCSLAVITKVNINTAEETELKTAGFSSTQASALISYRNENGSFEALEDIMKVSGIGEKTFLAVRDKICLA